MDLTISTISQKINNIAYKFNKEWKSLVAVYKIIILYMIRDSYSNKIDYCTHL